MFGGLAFLVNGNMALSASGQGGLLVRVEPGQTDQLARRANVHRFEMRGRSMDGWLRVDDEGLNTKRQLDGWVARGVAYARSLPPKTTKRRHS
jgi:TfoX N-terminal domain